MESSMVSLAETYNAQIKQFVDTNLLDVKITESKVHGPFFYTELKDKLIKVVIQGDIGGFEIKIFIENEKFSLWQFDRSVNNKTQSTSENILYQLNVLKTFLSDTV